MKQGIGLGCALLTGWLVFSAAAHAGGAGSQARGVVRDPSGSLVAGARVVAFDRQSGSRLEAMTASDGSFCFLLLPPGEYSFSAEAIGFRTGTCRDVSVGPSQRLEIIINLQDRGNTAGCEVVPSAEVSTTISRAEIQNLPLLSLKPVTLGVFQPGFQIQGGDEKSSHVNGTRRGSNNLTLDSIGVNDPVTPSLGTSTAAITADNVDVLRVIATGAGAEHGRNSGAQILYATRTGGNRWFGSAFNYLQNAYFNANDFFNNAANGERPQDNQNIFGFSLGGPLIADRTAVFGSYEGQRFRKEIVRNRTVLTSYAKSGLFVYLPRVVTENYNVLTYDIPANDPRAIGIDPQVSAALNLLPDPNNGDVGDGLNTAGYRFNNPVDGRDDQVTFRMDHRLSQNHRVFYRHTWGRGDQVDYLHNADATFPGRLSGRQKGTEWGFSSGSDWSFSLRTLNEFRFGLQDSSTTLTRPARLSTPMMISGLWTDPLNPDFPSDGGSRIYNISDHATLLRGKHSFKFGAEAGLVKQNMSDHTGVYPDLTFGTSFGNVPPSSIGPNLTVLTSEERRTFELLYNALLGRVGQVTQTFNSNLVSFLTPGTGRVRNYRFREYGFFLQDNWKVRRNLSLSLGLRYELGGAPTESNGLLGTLDQVSSLMTPSSQISDLTVEPGGSWYKTDVNNFSLRIGFVWDRHGDGNLVIRGGYGIFYDRLVGAAANFVGSYTPGYSRNVTAFPNAAGNDVRLSDGVPLPAQPDAPTSTLPATRSTSVAVFDPDLRSAEIRSFRLMIQKQFFHSTWVEAGYVGARGSHLFLDVNRNQPAIAGDFLTAFKQIQAYRTSLTPVPSFNTLVRLFGSVNGAVSAIGGSTFDQGLVGLAADTVDLSYCGRYSAAGLSDYYLRSFPQFDKLVVGTSKGRSYYDSLQVFVRHRASGLYLDAGYTWSKSLDNSSTDAGGFSLPIDSSNVALNKGRSDFDRTHVVTARATYTLPAPARSWLRDAPLWAAQLINGWELGILTLWESGLPFTVSSGRQTAVAGVNSRADYSGQGDIGQVIRDTRGIYYFYLDQVKAFSFPNAGEIGTSGRNTFRGPRYFDIDVSAVKHFRFREAHDLMLRIEAYNLFNRANFSLPNSDLSSSFTFGRIDSTVGNPRTLQVALRYRF